MVKHFFNAVFKFGTSEAQNELILAGENMVKNYKDSRAWEKLLVDTGDFFIKTEKEKNTFFEELACALSKENLSEIAKELKTEDGYDLESRLYKCLMQLMRRYEISYEIAESYTDKIIYTVLEQLRIVAPDKYEHYFLKEWKEEQNRNLLELKKRIDKMSNDLAVYNHEQISILSSGQIDIDLRRSTQNPSIGIEFFIVDDENFQDEFEDLRHKELVFVRGRSREETIYCVLNELWRLDDKRPIYIVKDMESWKKLSLLKNSGNVYIPWFYADEIVAIENNTNIFVVDENTPVFNKDVLELRPRTHDTLSKCLRDAGMEYEKIYALLADTHGLYIQMKKQLFKGEYLKAPKWITGISEKAKKTCLLIGSWEEIEGDELVIESLYGDSYDKFLEEILPYTKGEDPFLYVIRRNSSVSYYLASIENIWSYLDVLTNEPIWQLFVKVFLEVINESENLFSYNGQERLIAQLRGEKLFWSETIRKGMLQTLLIKGTYKSNKETKRALNRLVETVLEYVKTEKQWIYISKFWRELCEISPLAVLKRMDCELINDTGLLKLFQNQTSDFLFGENAYIQILWGSEQFLVQKEFFWPAFEWLLKLDSFGFEYKSNTPEGIFEKVLCPWMNFSVLETSNEKIKAAEKAFEIDPEKAWDYIYNAIDINKTSLLGEMSAPKYRTHEVSKTTTVADMNKTKRGYFNLILQHMDFSVERWKKMLQLSESLSVKSIDTIFRVLLFEVQQMSDEEIVVIKNTIRHLIYRHRYYKFASWAMPEEKISKYEKMLNEIHIATPEYEYAYLFATNGDTPLLYPIPANKDGGREDNEKAMQFLIQEKIEEFQNKRYSLIVLANACSPNEYRNLGHCLAKYWNNGMWNFEIFKEIIQIEKFADIAVSYLDNMKNVEKLPYSDIIMKMTDMKCSDNVIAKVYKVEARVTKTIPLITNASDIIKKEFWKSTTYCQECNYLWALKEAKKYATFNTFLEQMHHIHYYKPLSASTIFECFKGVEYMSSGEEDQMTRYHVQQLLEVLQEAYIDDYDKCVRVSHLEILFMNLLDWKDMKCYHKIVKQSPEFMAELVSIVFKREHDQNKKINQDYFHNMYCLYDKSHFCPAEKNGKVLEVELEQWVEKYRNLLNSNDQQNLFGTTLGRLFAFSPIDEDGYEPCMAVRKMIEKYGDDRMINSYQVAVFNRRGGFSPSAGKTELKIALDFKDNAEYLNPDYPKTARIFYNLYKEYLLEAENARKDAEDGLE